MTSFRTNLRLAVLDFSGTLIDHYSLGPITLFRKAFESVGMPVCEEKIKRYMGLPKIQTIRKIIGTGYYSKEFIEKKVQEINASMLKLSHEIIPEYSVPIPEALEGMRLMRSKGWILTATTGFPRSIGEKVRESAFQHGLNLDLVVYSDDVDYPRPNPGGIYEIYRKLGYPEFEKVIKAGDTPADILEGKRARVDLTCGLTKYSVAPRALREANPDRLYPTLYELAHQN